MSSSESEGEVLALFALARRRRNRKKTRIFVHEIFQRRTTFGEYHHLVQELYFHPDKFRQYFRMSEEQFDYVLNSIEEDIKKEDTKWRKSISARERLSICLRFLATGDSYKTISFSYRVGISAVSEIIREVCDAIWKNLQPIHLPAPSQAQLQQIAEEYNNRWNFPNCIGALDGKHVLIQAPPNSGSTYFNYKRTFSIVLLALIDAGYRFTYVDIGSYGSNSDAGIFRRSILCKKLENDSLGVPDDRPLPNADDEGPTPHVIVGDEAFPLMVNLMRPFPGTGLDDAQRIFNYRLSRARRLSENAFGILANRWRMYHRKVPVSPDSVVSLVKATVVLHNMLQSRNNMSEADVAQATQDDQDIHDGILRPLRRAGRRPANEAVRVREKFKDYFVSARGAVPWQVDACFGQAN